MPIYEYECTACGIHFERLQRFGDAPPPHCPEGHDGVRKVLSPPLIIFKGSGFYCTDNGNGRSSKNDGKESEPTAD
jgi:putative FmdB family regulatory protein